ncbi:MAG: glycosyltransferase [Bacteroidetes bacterium]|nr:glycosyltransferase [Bacteroidota bacterium]
MCVNDGSPDDSLQYAIEQKTNFKELVILDLSRNFGHHYAAHAGISYLPVELIFVIDFDPEVSPFQFSLTFIENKIIFLMKIKVGYYLGPEIDLLKARNIHALLHRM